MTEQAEVRAVDGANPADVRDKDGNRPQEPMRMNQRVAAEDLKAIAFAHEFMGNDRRANELRNLIGEEAKGPVEAFLTRPRRITVLGVVIGAAVSGAGYGVYRYIKRRSAKQGPMASVVPLPSAAQPPFMVTSQ